MQISRTVSLDARCKRCLNLRDEERLVNNTAWNREVDEYEVVSLGR